MSRSFSINNIISMAGITVLVMIMMLTSVRASNEIDHARRSLFGSSKTSTLPPANNEESSFSGSISKWLDVFLSGNSDKDDKQSNLLNKLALLKQILASTSSSSGSNDKTSKLDKLFQILEGTAIDNKNQASSSTNKLNRLLEFFNGHSSSSSPSSSSSNLQLAMKLLNLAQGSGNINSLSLTDMKSIMKLLSG